MKILSVNQIYQADKFTLNEQDIRSVDLVERVAILCYKWVEKKYRPLEKTITLFCGVGNNGADGLAMARHLFQNGYKTHIYVVNFSENRSRDFIDNYRRLKSMGVYIEHISKVSDFPVILNNALIIDAIFGIGLNKSAGGFTSKLIELINSFKLEIISIDIPSGLYAERANKKEDSIVKSSHILTFQSVKKSLLLPCNENFVHSWEVLDIGLSISFIKSLNVNNYYIDSYLVKEIYKPRLKFSHKGTFGHCLLIGGSYGKIGAIVLSARASLKSGSGLVSALVPLCGLKIIQTTTPEVMVIVDEKKCLSNFNLNFEPSAIGIGPGLGTAETTILGFEKFLKRTKIKMVIDADAINIISKNMSLLNYLANGSILTPHPKELKRLIGGWEDDYDKLEKAKKFSKRFDIILVIKGAHTAIVKGDCIYFNSSGNSALATAGSGDVLTGIITSLLSQKYSSLDAAILGVYLHGRTSDLAINEIAQETFIASDIIDYLSTAYLELKNDRVQT